MLRLPRIGLAGLVLLLIVGCSDGSQNTSETLQQSLASALNTIHLNEQALSLPKLDGFIVSRAARLAIVDAVMENPLTLIELSRQLTDTTVKNSTSTYLSQLLAPLGIKAGQSPLDPPPSDAAKALWNNMPERSGENASLSRTLRPLLNVIANAQQYYESSPGYPGAEEWITIQKHLATAVHSTDPEPETHRLDLDAYHQLGAKTDVMGLAIQLQRLFTQVEQALPDLRRIDTASLPLEWETPLGRVRIAGASADHHSGEFLLLIDLGGNDTYVDVGRTLQPGQVSIVIDLGGNDVVHWETVPGPGSGIMGIGLWADLSGNDQYTGRNLGLGVGVFGAGLLWDAQGDDIYKGGARVQGVGQYGVGVLLDSNGNDTYEATFTSQGYGSTGGYGIQVDLQGNDRYACTPLVPDQVAPRIKRHGSTHYISMCQGYGFGRRETISGGVGLLLDRSGNDHYTADIFAQGASLWFGLGMLLDGAGNDHYEAFEHCQGASLHIGAGLLADWQGNDRYVGYEHCQGTGIDRAVGMLYDQEGDDYYRSHHESQGTGVKPYGVGLLFDAQGNDHYEAVKTSQGHSARPPKPFPENQWPMGVLLDLNGNDVFIQPAVPRPGPVGRVQNRQGIAVDN